ncbi:MAG: extracellular solute-binding protein [Candidatus Eiseniibacteriota bacterium]|nr:MAG: extracellular solute-binding protein [Candidatus Eisenbacteria bacterium]
MRKAKLLLHVVCAAAVLLGALGGCGRKDEGIAIWEQMDPEEQKLLQARIAAFERAHPGVAVTTLHFETEQLQTQFQTAALAGGGPCLVFGPSDKVGPYSVMKLIRPLDELFGEEFFSLFVEGSLDTLNGHIYAIPDQVGNHLALVYNRKFVKTPPTSTDEFISIAKQNTVDENGDGITDRYGLVFNAVEPFWLVPFLGGFGGWVMDEDHAPTLDTPAMVKALRFVSDLRAKHRVLPKECDYQQAETLFKEGKAAMMINGPWSWGGYISAGIDVGLAPLPRMSETGLWPTPMVSSKGYSVNVNCPREKLELVKELLDFLTSPENQMVTMRRLRMLPARKAIADSLTPGSDLFLDNSLIQLKHGRRMPVVPEMRAIWDSMRPSYQNVLNQEMIPEEAARTMQKTALERIARMKE